MKYWNIFLWILFLWIVTIAQGFSQSNLDSLLQELNKAISNKEVRVQKKLARIEVLKNKLHALPEITTEEQFDLYNKLFHEYKVFIYYSDF